LDDLGAKIKTSDFELITKAMDAIVEVLAIDSSTRQSIDSSLQEFSNMLGSLGIFSEYFERNPNALLAGKT
jgi:hypothetical protein